ncbi:MAG: hypothetical protein DRZ82_09855 [Thermoprotei archaeon]|nr:MAG: hypothetical protein DRZ82_09855 [Thermoprotei archaeon]
MVKASSAERIEKYDDKRTTSMVVAYKRRVEERRPNLEALGARAELDSKVAGILTSHNVSSAKRIDYHNFARYIEKRKREGTLTPDIIEAAKAHWTALNCDEAILDEIIQAITGAQG